MGSHTVTSGAGAKIEIVDDGDWCLTAGVPMKGLRLWHGNKPAVIRTLWEHGRIEHKSGQASARLYSMMGEASGGGNQNSVSTLLNDTANAPAFKRDVRGKRTYAIELVALPEIWYGKLMRDIEEDTTVFEAIRMNGDAPAIEELPPDPFQPIYDENRETIGAFERGEIIPIETSPAIEVEIASQVAMELLTRVVEIISAGSAADANPELRKLRNELAHGQGILSQRLEENDRLRRQVRETGEELLAVKSERDGLRQRLRQTEANLNAALKGESAGIVTTEVMKRVDRIMRETPKGKGE